MKTLIIEKELPHSVTKILKDAINPSASLAGTVSYLSATLGNSYTVGRGGSHVWIHNIAGERICIIV